MTPREVLERYGLGVRRDLGQCFLVDPNIIRRIADAATSGGEATVVEIGPGLGALTKALLKRGVRVVAVEKDRGFVPLLREELGAQGDLHVIEGDARHVDFAEIAGTRPAVVGNLPYSVTTDLLLALLRQRAAIGTTTVMIQKEVADRLLAGPNTKTYGSLTVLFGLHADISRVCDVGAGAFWPAPKVRSTVLSFEWLASPRVDVPDTTHFERVVRAAFGQRRKTLSNALSAVFDRDQVRAVDVIDLKRRAETLSLSEFACLASALGPGDTDRT